jgi:alpha-L-fucosidase
MVRKLQPEILINNRSGLKEDFGTPEQFARPDAEQAWECCMTVGCERGWGYLRYDADLKTPASLLAVLVNCASHGGNFLLNIGPKSNGSVPAKIKNRLFKIGEWLDKYGDSIYETEAGPGGGAAGFCTQKGKTIYLHTLWWPGTKVALPRIKEPVKSAKILSTGQKLTVAKTKDGRLQLSGLPSAPPDYTNTVIQITCQ